MQHQAHTPTDQSTNSQPALEHKLSVNISRRQNQTHVLLPTAIIYVEHGTTQAFRALLDLGSQCTLVSEACAQQFDLELKFDQTLLYGINANQGTRSKRKVMITIVSNKKYKISTEALSSVQITDGKLACFKHLELADKQHNIPSKIDVVLGAEVFTQCYIGKKLAHPSGNPTGTIFRWVIIGETSASESPTIISCHVNSLDNLMIWDIWK